MPCGGLRARGKDKLRLIISACRRFDGIPCRKPYQNAVCEQCAATCQMYRAWVMRAAAPLRSAPAYAGAQSMPLLSKIAISNPLTVSNGPCRSGPAACLRRRWRSLQHTGPAHQSPAPRRSQVGRRSAPQGRLREPTEPGLQQEYLNDRMQYMNVRLCLAHHRPTPSCSMPLVAMPARPQRWNGGRQRGVLCAANTHVGAGRRASAYLLSVRFGTAYLRMCGRKEPVDLQAACCSSRPSFDACNHDPGSGRMQ